MRSGPDDQNRRRLIDVTNIGLAVCAEADGWNFVEQPGVRRTLPFVLEL